MAEQISEKISKLDEKKRELELKKKLLIEKERQKSSRIKSKRFAVIGKAASRVGIDHLDDMSLLGALIEIKENSTSEDKIQKWRDLGNAFVIKEKANNETPLSISFQSEIGKVEKELMKSLGFRFNKFRNEFYGYGKENDLKEKLNGFSYKLEVIESTGE